MASTMTRLICLLIAISASGQTQSAQAWLTTKITRNLVGSVNYGGCMIRVDTLPSTVLADCPDWVTFSCSGDFNSKAEGNLKLQSAQLGLLTGYQIYLQIDDTKKHNGYCYARRIDVYR